MNKKGEDLDKKIEELKEKKEILKENKDKNRQIEELKKEIKQYSRSQKTEDLNRTLKSIKEGMVKFISEASKGIGKIQEYNKRNLEEKKIIEEKNTKNLNNSDNKQS